MRPHLHQVERFRNYFPCQRIKRRDLASTEWESMSSPTSRVVRRALVGDGASERDGTMLRNGVDTNPLICLSILAMLVLIKAGTTLNALARKACGLRLLDEGIVPTYTQICVPLCEVFQCLPPLSQETKSAGQYRGLLSPWQLLSIKVLTTLAT